MDKRFGLKTSCIADIVNVLKLQPEVEEAIIFGSRATGSYKNGSDIDIALKGEKITFDTLSTIRLRLDELPYLYMYDVVDYKKISNPAVTTQIDQTGITFYKKTSMPSGWKTYKLGEIASVQTGPFGSQLHQSDYVADGTPIITVEHLGENRIIHSNLPMVSNEDKERLSRYWLTEGDIVFSRVGSVDRRAYVKRDEEGWLFSGRCLRVRPKEKVTGKYLSYFFGLEDFKRKIRSIAVGATMPSLNTSIMNDIEVLIPKDLKLQKEIATILSSLDDKIELNLQMNQTLEAMAQAIFKEWFVHFNFPGFDGELVDGLPKGWRNDRFENHFDVLRGLSYKGSGLSQKDIGIPMYNLNSVYEGGGFKYEGIKFYNGEYKEKHLVRPRDIIVANTEQGHKYLLIGFPAVVPFYFGDPAIFSHHIYRLRPKENSSLTPQFMYYLLLQQDIREQIIGCSNGTTVNMLKIDGLQIPIFKMPQRELIQQFSDIVEPIWQRQENNIRENESLTQIRDTLLPKLMSGQLEVPYG